MIHLYKYVHKLVDTLNLFDKHQTVNMCSVKEGTNGVHHYVTQFCAIWLVFYNQMLFYIKILLNR